MKRKLWTWLRILVSLVLMALIVRSVNLNQALAILERSDLRFLLLAAVLNLLTTLLLALRWRVLLLSQGLRVGYWRLVATYLTGLFFSNFLPSNIGGDLVRAYYVWKDSGKRATAVASVLVERLIGSLSLFGIALFSAALVGSVKGSREFLVVVGLVTLAFLLLIWLFFNRRLVAFLDKSLGSPDFFKLRVKARKLYDALYSYLDKKQAAFEVFGITLLLQVIFVLMWCAVGRALELNLGLIVYFLYIPVVGVLLVLPVSINAWGLQEWSVVGLFARAGLAKEEALTLSLVIHLIVSVMNLIGGITFLARGEKPGEIEISKADWEGKG